MLPRCFPRPLVFRRCWLLPLAAATFVGLAAGSGAVAARGQALTQEQMQERSRQQERDTPRQERGLLQRIMSPDRTMRYDPAIKKFTASGATLDKHATLRTFGFSKPASTKAFVSKDFAGAAGFGTRDFAKRDRAATDGSRVATDSSRAFGTRDVAVRAAPAADRTFATRDAKPRPFLVQGKRQDTLDEWAREHPMTIQEVRELLNKNN